MNRHHHGLVNWWTHRSETGTTFHASIGKASLGVTLHPKPHLGVVIRLFKFQRGH